MRAVYDEKKVAVKYFRSAEEKRGYKQEVYMDRWTDEWINGWMD